ncbi:hypothetical protein CB0940_11866 [Cercospora beticola]|uniref:Uncharacterized protein n=1 Tax=Cercospora beticola TaxID=122368 RepID=A0A2G5IFK0_CERBT|nr:hypothetical protein CB0940_11866 [Cercospora beticola]PIB03243.1 hypothetical protein CB0940_11866 [Cercospora beticola]WPB04227.1 hypothetical protein RHO25_008872 [Cercospora beticola]CAK1356961.1 unnamed protein product [Cercospora beticola]
MPKHSRLLKELRHEPVNGRSIFANPDILSSSQAASQSQSPHSTGAAHQRRAIRPVPAGILDQCTICMEEQLFSQAFALLESGLSAGFDTNAPACIPPPQHLALASTLVVHPSMTTRTDDPDKRIAADHAAKYLREVVAMVGVEGTGLPEALQFGQSNNARTGRTKRAKTRRSDAVYESDENEDTSRLRSHYSERQSLGENAQDFWAVVGWAFNCSVKHKARWQRWRIWLELMLDVLQHDLAARVSQGMAHAKNNTFSKTLFAQYMSTVGAGRNNMRRLMRAVLADGSEKSLREFGEIWKNETKPPKKKEESRSAKRRKLDLDNDDYGDYLENYSEEDAAETRSARSRSVTASRRRRSRTPANPDTNTQDDDRDSGFEDTTEADAIEQFGGMETIQLRQRFLAIFTAFSRAAPTLFVDTEELFSIFTEFIRPLPLQIFQQFTLPTTAYLSADLQTSLNEMMSRPLLGTHATQGLIDQREFEASFATCTATNASFVDNAKVSLLSESMLRALWTSGHLIGDLPRLKTLVEQGIQMRSDKTATDGRRKAGKKSYLDEEAKIVLDCSGQRMGLLLRVIVGR